MLLMVIVLLAITAASEITVHCAPAQVTASAVPGTGFAVLYLALTRHI